MLLGGWEGGGDLMYECEIETKRSTTSADQKVRQGTQEMMKVNLLQSNLWMLSSTELGHCVN